MPRDGRTNDDIEDLEAARDEARDGLADACKRLDEYEVVADAAEEVGLGGVAALACQRAEAWRVELVSMQSDLGSDSSIKTAERIAGRADEIWNEIDSAQTDLDEDVGIAEARESAAVTAYWHWATL